MEVRDSLDERECRRHGLELGKNPRRTDLTLIRDVLDRCY